MKLRTVLVCLSVLSLVSLAATVSTKSGGAPARPAITFNDDIQPLLADNCYACHGADPGSRKAQLRLDRA